MPQDREESAQPTTDPPPPPQPAPEPAPAAAEPAQTVDLATLVTRVAKMQNKLVQDIATVTQAQTALTHAMTEGFAKLQITFGMLTKQVATNDVKLETHLTELRKQLATDLGSVSSSLASEIAARTVESIMLTAVADIIDNAEVVLAQASPEQQADPMVTAVRMMRDKLLIAFRPLGVELVPIIAGTTKFDENLHEVVNVAPADDPLAKDAPANTITGIYNHGYTLNGRTIRRARVVMKGA
jgi:molecular chaperone GrpE (heat shock protein)